MVTCKWAATNPRPPASTCAPNKPRPPHRCHRGTRTSSSPPARSATVLYRPDRVCVCLMIFTRRTLQRGLQCLHDCYGMLMWHVYRSSFIRFPPLFVKTDGRAHTSGSPCCQSVIFIEFSRKHRQSPQATQRASSSRFPCFFLMKSSENRIKKRSSDCIKFLLRRCLRRSCGCCCSECYKHRIWVLGEPVEAPALALPSFLRVLNSNAALKYSQA